GVRGAARAGDVVLGCIRFPGGGDRSLIAHVPARESGTVHAPAGLIIWALGSRPVVRVTVPDRNRTESRRAQRSSMIPKGDPERWKPVFGKDHAPTMTIRRKVITLEGAHDKRGANENARGVADGHRSSAIRYPDDSPDDRIGAAVRGQPWRHL